MKKTVTKLGSEITGTTGSIWNSLPLGVKGIIILGGGYLAYKIGKNIYDKSRANPETRDDKQEEDGWNSSLIKDSANQKPTLSKTQMKQLANSLENMLDGYGSRDTSIKKLFKENIKNDADFSGLNAAFGIRTIEAGRGFGWLAGHERGTLTQVIQEADDTTLDYINKLFSQRGIKYRV